jgi:2'-phosphotransferase
MSSSFSASSSSSKSRAVEVSKLLSWLLRHGAAESNLAMRADGFARVANILAVPSLARKRVDAAELAATVLADKKTRFSYRPDASLGGNEPAEASDPASSESIAAANASLAASSAAAAPLVLTVLPSGWLRANQGHTVAAVESESLLSEMSEAQVAALPQCCHGSYFEHWEPIRANGLSRMARRHLHLSRSSPGSAEVISGMRASCSLVVYVDLVAAMRVGGLRFFESQNGVVLTEGDADGFLRPQFFKRAVRLHRSGDSVSSEEELALV